MRATLRDVLYRVNAGTVYGNLEAQLGSEDASEHTIGTQAIEKAIRYLKESTSGEEGETEFEIQYANLTTHVFYLDYTY